MGEVMGLMLGEFVNEYNVRVVDWYHSHPGFGCWLSSTDVSTQSL